MKEEFVRFWLLRFRKLDMTQPEQRQALVDTFINAIYLYDDKVLITFNYKEGTETVAFGEAVKAEKSSDMSARGAPRSLTKVSDLFCFVRTVRHSALRTTPPLAFHLYKEGGRGCCVRCLLFKLLCHILQQLADGQVLGADLLASAAADAV